MILPLPWSCCVGGQRLTRSPSPKNCPPLSGNYLLLEVICPLMGKGNFQLVLKTWPSYLRVRLLSGTIHAQSPCWIPAEITTLLSSVICCICFSHSHSPEIPPPLNCVHPISISDALPMRTLILLVPSQKCLGKEGQRFLGSERLFPNSLLTSRTFHPFWMRQGFHEGTCH